MRLHHLRPTDVFWSRPCDGGVVVFRIRVHSREPLTGTVGFEGAEPQRFVGWLGLLRLLGEGVGAEATLSSELGELAARSEPELVEDVHNVRFHCPP